MLGSSWLSSIDFHMNITFDTTAGFRIIGDFKTMGVYGKVGDVSDERINIPGSIDLRDRYRRTRFGGHKG